MKTADFIAEYGLTELEAPHLHRARVEIREEITNALGGVAALAAVGWVLVTFF